MGIFFDLFLLMVLIGMWGYHIFIQIKIKDLTATKGESQESIVTQLQEVSDQLDMVKNRYEDLLKRVDDMDNRIYDLE